MYSIVNVEVPEEYAEIYVLGDKHYGLPEKSHDRKLIQRVLQTVVLKNAKAIAAGKKPYCFVVGIGDTLDLSIKGRFGEIGKDKAVNQAAREFKKDFQQVALKGYYLGDVPGNHDVRITNSLGSGWDVVEEWFDDLREMHGVNIGYGAPHLILDVKVGRSTFTGFLTHGSGAGGTAGSVANSMMKNRNELSNFDFAVQGHFHRDIYTPELRAYYNPRSKSVHTQIQHFFTVNSAQKKSGYAAVGRFANTGTSAVLLKLHASPENNHSKPKDLQYDVIWGAVENLSEFDQ